MIMLESKEFFKCEVCDLILSESFDICPKCGSTKKMMSVRLDRDNAVNNEWLDTEKFFEGKGYGVFTSNGSHFYIPGAEHIEMIDEDALFGDDEEACKQAEKDGVKLIYGMEGVPDGVYIDTFKNRNIIIKSLEQNPEYKKLDNKEVTIIEIEEVVAANAFDENGIKAVDFQVDVTTNNEELNSEYPFITVWIEDRKIQSPKYMALFTRDRGEVKYILKDEEKLMCIEKINNYIYNKGWKNI